MRIDRERLGDELHGVEAFTRALNRRERGQPMEQPKEKQRRGFASMDLEKRRAIAKLGGIAAHKQGTAHEWTTREAQVAGKKGGSVSRGGRGRVEP